MAVEIKGYRVFIASPSGLDKEREGFNHTLEEYNKMDAIHRGVIFWPVGWEETLGGIGRPQSIINEEVRTCDYFVMVLWDRWGSAPDKNGEAKYSSGTEEEYHIALECLKNEEIPMQQIVVFFKGVDERRLSDPGEQLKKVIAFKKELEEKKTLLFHTYDEEEEFNNFIRRYLARWIRDHESGETAEKAKPEVPPEISPVGKETGIDKVEEEKLNVEDLDISDEVKEAWYLVEEGRLTDAETKFAELIVSGVDAIAFRQYGIFLQQVGRIAQAEVMLERALEIDKKTGQLEGMASDYSNLGLIYEMRGDLDKAEEMYKKALEIKEKLGQQEGIANNYGNLGLIYYTRGDLDKAEEMHKKSLEIKEKLGLQEGMASSYGNLGLVYQARGDLDKAEEMHKKSLEIETKIGRLEGMASDYGNLGAVCYKRGDLDKAEEMLQKALEIKEKLGLKMEMASDYGNLGEIYRIRGELDKAVEMHKKALEINKKLGRLEGIANVYSLIGIVYGTRGDLDKAEEMFRKGLKIEEKLGRLHGMASEYGNLGEIYRMRDDIDKAEEMYVKSLQISELQGMVESTAIQYSNLGLVYKVRGDVVKAKEFWEKAVDLFKKMGMPHKVEKVETWLSELSQEGKSEKET